MLVEVDLVSEGGLDEESAVFGGEHAWVCTPAPPSPSSPSSHRHWMARHKRELFSSQDEVQASALARTLALYATCPSVRMLKPRDIGRCDLGTADLREGAAMRTFLLRADVVGTSESESRAREVVSALAVQAKKISKFCLSEVPQNRQMVFWGVKHTVRNSCVRWARLRSARRRRTMLVRIRPGSPVLALVV